VVAVGVQRVLADRYELGLAVKVLREQYATDPVFLALFTRAARHVAGLPHPGLVTIFDAGVDGRTAVIVMELVRGRTLRDAAHRAGGAIATSPRATSSSPTTAGPGSWTSASHERTAPVR
jgi:serine/threonine protein kinase